MKKKKKSTTALVDSDVFLIVKNNTKYKKNMIMPKNIARNVNLSFTHNFYLLFYHLKIKKIPIIFSYFLFPKAFSCNNILTTERC